jgi:CxxC-x17-CxxC domain-containing protein
MGDFNRGGGGGFRGNRGGGFGGGRDGGRPSFQKKSWGDKPEMHKAICSNCGKSCEVPFRPSGDKPVYCSDCFGKTSGGADRAPRREFNDRAPQARPSFDGSNQGGSDTKRQLEAISAKLDKLTQAIENFSKVRTAPVANVIAQEKVAIKALTSQPKKVVAKVAPKVADKKVAKKVVAKKGKK